MSGTDPTLALPRAKPSTSSPEIIGAFARVAARYGTAVPFNERASVERDIKTLDPILEEISTRLRNRDEEQRLSPKLPAGLSLASRAIKMPQHLENLNEIADVVDGARTYAKKLLDSKRHGEARLLPHALKELLHRDLNQLSDFAKQVGRVKLTEFEESRLVLHANIFALGSAIPPLSLLSELLDHFDAGKKLADFRPSLLGGIFAALSLGFLGKGLATAVRLGATPTEALGQALPIMILGDIEYQSASRPRAFVNELGAGNLLADIRNREVLLDQIAHSPFGGEAGVVFHFPDGSTFAFPELHAQTIDLRAKYQLKNMGARIKRRETFGGEFRGEDAVKMTFGADESYAPFELSLQTTGKVKQGKNSVRELAIKHPEFRQFLEDSEGTINISAHPFMDLHPGKMVLTPRDVVISPVGPMVPSSSRRLFDTNQSSGDSERSYP